MPSTPPRQAPVAPLAVTPAAAGGASSFDASASTVAYGTIASYSWSFGDGSTSTTTSPTTTHAYTSAGTFTAKVNETSSGGTSTTQVFTGQTVGNNGGPQAVAFQRVVVPTATTTPTGYYEVASDGGVFLTPGFKCYDLCSDAWSGYINGVSVI